VRVLDLQNVEDPYAKRASGQFSSCYARKMAKNDLIPDIEVFYPKTSLIQLVTFDIWFYLGVFRLAALCSMSIC